MRVATFNINNINKRLPNLLTWLESEQPDVVCLQELKSEDFAFPSGGERQTGRLHRARALPALPTATARASTA